MEITETYNAKTLEDIKCFNSWGMECWYAKDLMTLLNYAKWENFEKVIKKAITSCNNSNQDAENHFTEIKEIVKSDTEEKEKIIDYRLSRYACYLIIENASPRKEQVALAKNYIAIQTIKQERKEEDEAFKLFVQSQAEAKIKREKNLSDIDINKIYNDTEKILKETMKNLKSTKISELSEK